MNEPEQKLLPELSRISSLERKYARTILALNPGLSTCAISAAKELVDAGLPPAAATMVIQTVYSPEDAQGRGQSTRIKYMVQAVQNRYKDRLEAVRNNMSVFRGLLAEIAQVVEMRDVLKGEDKTVSFEQAFMLNEAGLDEESTLALLSDLSAHETPGRAKQIMLKAVQCVQRGAFCTIEAAIDSIRYGYVYERQPDNGFAGPKKQGVR